MASLEAIQRALREFNTHGYCVVRGRFDPALVEACRASLRPEQRSLMRFPVGD